MSRFTATEKAREALRELRMREQVYRRMVAENQLTAKVAEQRIALMQEIADEYAALEQGERLL